MTKQLYQLDWYEFEKKLALWNITPASLVKVIYEDYLDYFIFYLPCPEADYCCVISKTALTPVNRMNLMAISIPGIRITDEVKVLIQKPKLDLETQEK